MANKKQADKAAPAANSLAVEAPSTSAQSSVPAPEKQLYYRIRKINGYLAEILEVEIDETQIKPKAVSKQDSWHLLLDKIVQFVYPSPDELARRKREAAKLAAKK